LYAEESGEDAEVYYRMPKPEADDEEDKERAEQAANLKRQLYQLAASFDRGFGATPRSRKEADDIIQQLSEINPTKDASRGIDGVGAYGEEVPLKAIWRMVWTTAFDVVSLGASPFAGEFLFSTYSFHFQGANIYTLF
jgi:hypothetical protein